MPVDSEATSAGTRVADMTFWQKVCRGEAHFLLNILFCLPVLAYKAVELYIVPTAIVSLNRAMGCLHQCVWWESCCGPFAWTDPDFGPTTGDPNGNAALGKELEHLQVEWVRAEDLEREPSSGPPMEQDMTPTRAAGVLAYTSSFFCAVYMAIREVIEINNTGAGGAVPPFPPSMPPLPPLPPSPFAPPLLPSPFAPPLTPSAPPPFLPPSLPAPAEEAVGGLYHVAFGFSVAGTVVCGVTLVCGRTHDASARAYMALGFLVAAICMGLAFLWFVPNGDAAHQQYGLEWGLALNIVASAQLQDERTLPRRLSPPRAFSSPPLALSRPLSPSLPGHLLLCLRLRRHRVHDARALPPAL